MIPKARIEALTDGIFGFAMTLLVTGLAFPAGFMPKTSNDLLAAVQDLDGSIIAYIVSFFVLGIRWFGQAQDKEDPEKATGVYLWAILIHLFFITLVPFSTLVIGRYDDVPAAVWLYSANMGLSALAAIAISLTAERATGKRPKETGRFALLMLMAAALLSIPLSLISSRLAMAAYLLTAFTPFVQRWAGRLA